MNAPLLKNPASTREGRSTISKRQSHLSHSWDRVGPRNERRQACRYPASKHSAYLGWWQDGEYRTIGGSLVNISLEGALVHVDDPPPADASVWVCLEGDPEAVWVESVVVELTREKNKPLLARLRFRETCPFAFFNSAVQQSSSSNVKEPVSPQFDGRYWK
jgi:hypothetical protein